MGALERVGAVVGIGVGLVSTRYKREVTHQ